MSGKSQKRWSASLHEFSLANVKGVDSDNICWQLSSSGDVTKTISFKPSGRIDSLYLIDGCLVVCDYKRNALPTQIEVASGEDPQLAFYSCLLTSQGLGIRNGSAFSSCQHAVVGYWSILEGKWVSRAIDETAKSVAISCALQAARKVPTVEQIIVAMNNKFSKQLQNIEMSSGCSFVPTPSEKSCLYCQYESICRKSSEI